MITLYLYSVVYKIGGNVYNMNFLIYLKLFTYLHIINESTEVQTLAKIRIQLYHQCFEQVQQHNFTSIIGLRRSTQQPSIFKDRHIDLRMSTHRPSIFEGQHIDLRRSKAETSNRHSDNSLQTIVHNDAP